MTFSAGTIDIMVTGARWLAYVIFTCGLLQTAVYMFQLVVAGYALARRPPVARANLLWHRFADVAPPISIIVPAYNEQYNVIETAHSLLSIEYPSFEVIVVNDGSTDNTLDLLIEAFELKPTTRPYEMALEHAPIRQIYSTANTDRLIVIDKENGGKGDAQNAGVNVSRAPLFSVIDGDSILESDALLRAAQPFIEDPERTIAVGGTIRIANNSIIERGRVKKIRLPTKLVPLFQVVEYLRSFLMARLAWSRIDTLILISGAFGLFRRQEVIEVGGYTAGSMAEDMDLVLNLHRHMIRKKKPYRIEFIPEPVCWTEAPETLEILGRQRSRWQRGALECFFRYRGMFMNPRYGRIGLLGMSHVFIVDVIGPIAEVIGYVLIPLFWALDILAVEYLLAFTALVFVYGTFISVTSLILEELELRRFPRARDLAILAVAAVVENFGYRQLNNFWRVRGFWQYLRQDEAWGEMPRTGLGSGDS